MSGVQQSVPYLCSHISQEKQTQASGKWDKMWTGQVIHIPSFLGLLGGGTFSASWTDAAKLLLLCYCCPFVMPPHSRLAMPHMYFEICFLNLISTCVFFLTSSSCLIISTYKEVVSPWLPGLAQSLQVQLFVRNAFVEKTHPAWEGRREEKQCNIFPLLLLSQPIDHF